MVKTPINPSKVHANYVWILEFISNKMQENKPARFTEIHRSHNISKSQFYRVLKELEDGGYIHRIEFDAQPYYVLGKWGEMTLECDKIMALNFLSIAYDLEK